MEVPSSLNFADCRFVLLSSDRELTPELWVKGSIASEDLATELDAEIAEVRVVVKKIVESGRWSTPPR